LRLGNNGWSMSALPIPDTSGLIGERMITIQRRQCLPL
jgi:hypothetical protein